MSRESEENLETMKAHQLHKKDSAPWSRLESTVKLTEYSALFVKNKK
jgi:hypothetical protein